MLEQSQIIEEPKSLKRYLFFWSGQLSSILGSSIVFFSIIWWITIETGSVIFLSVAATISFLPNLITIPFAGTLVDRWDRKKVILTSDFLQAAVTLSVILTFTFGGQYVWLIILMNSLRGFFQNFHQPAVVALTPLMVDKDKLTRINGFTGMTGGLVRIIGPVIGALLLAFMSIEQIMWIDIITFLIGFSILLPLKIPHIKKKNGLKKEENEEKPPFWSEFKQGFKTMRDTPGLMTLALLCTFINFLLIPVNILMSFFIYDAHSGNEMNFAFVMIMMQIGIIFGSFIASIKKNWKNRQQIVLLTGILLFIGNFISAIAPFGNFFLIGFGRFILGVNISIGIALYNTILQISVPADQQGRIYSIDMVISFAISPIAMIISGPLAELIGITNYFMICAILGIVAHLVVWFFTKINSIDYDKIHEELEENSL